MFPIENFSVNKRNPDGTIKYRNSWCNPCRTEDNRERLGATKKRKFLFDIENNLKQCRKCEIMKDFSSFSPSARGVGSLSAYCKDCSNLREVPKEVGRAATARYRERHKERWRAAHRVHQFNRRSKIKATQDGTVTDDFIKMLLAKENCCWCNKFTEENERTLEHIEELCNGGLHSASNMDMACFSCNSSRKNRKK